MIATGLLIAGRKVLVPGVEVINSTDAGWCKLNPGDYRARKTKWVRGIGLHSTGGRWPMPISDELGPGDERERYADIWNTDPTHSAAHVVVDSRGRAACLADLQYVCAYHMTTANDVAVGIEMAQARDGTVRRVTINTAALICRAICDAMGIPFQFCSTPYANQPTARLVSGGADCCGIYGHRDQSDQRGRGDPGDAIYEALLAAGAEPLDYATGQDLAVGRGRQQWLNAEASRRGETWSPLIVDGLVGPASLARAKQLGFRAWRDVPVG